MIYLRVSAVVLLLSLMPIVAHAQGNYGQRTKSRDGQWMTPVASRILCSTENMHIGRGSVNAWDVCAPKGTPIYPMGAGRVTVANCGNAGGYGCWVMVDHGTMKSLYGHMISGSIRVKVGQQVDAWTLLGQVGWTGMTSFGPHVHWEIHKAQGGRYRPDQLFNVSLMRKCDLCAATGAPAIPQGVTSSTGAQRTLSLPSIPIQMLLVTLAFFLLLSGLYIFAGQSELLRHSIYHGMALYVSVVTLVMVAGVPASAGQAPAVSGAIAGGNAWEMAYKQAAKWEGSRCVHDPGRTMRGVTQSTYNAYRKSKGLPQADVCGITEQEAKVIYYERYWLPSGASVLPAALAMTHYDMAINAGVGVAKRILAQCGNNVGCYNNQREAFYKGARGCPAYCAGWLNRLRDMRKVTE
jgi:hypothetical protein